MATWNRPVKYDRITNFNILDVGSDIRNDPGALMAENQSLFPPRMIEVRVTDSRSFHLDQNFIFLGRLERKRSDLRISKTIRYNASYIHTNLIERLCFSV